MVYPGYPITLDVWFFPEPSLLRIEIWFQKGGFLWIPSTNNHPNGPKIRVFWEQKTRGVPQKRLLHRRTQSKDFALIAGLHWGCWTPLGAPWILFHRENLHGFFIIQKLGGKVFPYLLETAPHFFETTGPFCCCSNPVLFCSDTLQLGCIEQNIAKHAWDNHNRVSANPNAKQPSDYGHLGSQRTKKHHSFDWKDALLGISLRISAFKPFCSPIWRLVQIKTPKNFLSQLFFLNLSPLHKGQVYISIHRGQRRWCNSTKGL